MEERVVVPEILDSLPPNDAEAKRSRRDLRRINFFMGNERWICREIRHFREAACRGIVEIGAGDGALCQKLARMFPDTAVSAYDLAPAPPITNVAWHQGDLFQAAPPTGGGVLAANLFIHHFEGDSLKKLGRWMRHFDVLLINEPDRSFLPHLLGGIAHPFINRVTRHDMHVSIRAGFKKDELRIALGLDTGHWIVRETSTWRGARRVLAWRT